MTDDEFLELLSTEPIFTPAGLPFGYPESLGYQPLPTFPLTSEGFPSQQAPNEGMPAQTGVASFAPMAPMPGVQHVSSLSPTPPVEFVPHQASELHNAVTLGYCAPSTSEDRMNCFQILLDRIEEKLDSINGVQREQTERLHDLENKLEKIKAGLATFSADVYDWTRRGRYQYSPARACSDADESQASGDDLSDYEDAQEDGGDESDNREMVWGGGGSSGEEA